MKLNKRDPEGKRTRLRGVNRQHTGLLIRGVEVRVLPEAHKSTLDFGFALGRGARNRKSRIRNRKWRRAWNSSGRVPGS